MIKHFTNPTIIAPAGNKPKIIEEFIGRVTSGTHEISIARMKSPSGWVEPHQSPEFDEYTLVLRGTLHVSTPSGLFLVRGGECIFVGKGERVQYSTPGAQGAEYVAICLPAFSPDTVHREL